MLKNNLGYPRIGNYRELKKASEQYWAGKISLDELLQVGHEIRLANWKIQKEAGIDLIPSNDFSFYDQVLDMVCTVGAIPKRYDPLKILSTLHEMDLYFAMARGYQKDGLDITAMEMTKWFDTNYHYIVPEFVKDQQFELSSKKVVEAYLEAKEAGIQTKPVLIGPVSFLLLGKEKESGFDRIDLLERLLPVYIRLLKNLKAHGAEWVQLDEPCLATNLSGQVQSKLQEAYNQISKEVPNLKILLASYFDCYGQNLKTVLSLPVEGLHLDLVRCPSQLDDILSVKDMPMKILSLGVVDGRNIWKNDLAASLKQIEKAISQMGTDRLMVSPSCSLLHTPCDLETETNESVLTPVIKNWLAFARQKIDEVVTLGELADHNNADSSILEASNQVQNSRKTSNLIYNESVRKRVNSIIDTDAHRSNSFASRKVLQKEALQLPSFPTTTIGSFPQTDEIRKQRRKFKKGELTPDQYSDFLKTKTKEAIRWQEDIGLDVLVHGEFERNDMVEYFGEQLSGFVFTQNGWVQSYGSRCVKPPIIYGDVTREKPMTVGWSSYAQSLTDRLVKGMLTGPVTILQWSFVRNDQPRSQTCTQIALAIRDEVADLERAGIQIIQVDEPAIREGLPLRKEDWKRYLDWAVTAFKIATCGVKDQTQIHTHMCYSEFNDIIDSIAAMDADVITIECSRSQMELLDAFADFSYPNEIGPGVYDIHSPRVPTQREMVTLMQKAQQVINDDQLWVNPDCGLKTRGWEETRHALSEMVKAAGTLRQVSVEA